ncbi:conserved protein of unknown function (plasmid) [Rhodovastum atsumiense]|uniref:Uncharacterized protein n=1 Tax=Rhodovastum atsumiense TaxID=504468 RepID=A0A5M6IIY3_9PROT|nr:hypothetical protein [Rhodovastum atsumiense]KAA5608082.1 hypothetical protein F1189_30795 [Rhodovastum atsumiense]CAH2606534.1 conserved protein of unknown function [Rhodovastum atsumiense]
MADRNLSAAQTIPPLTHTGGMVRVIAGMSASQALPAPTHDARMAAIVSLGGGQVMPALTMQASAIVFGDPWPTPPPPRRLTAFDRAARLLHRDRNVGTDAEYRKPNTAWVPLRIVVSRSSNDLGTARGDAISADILTTDAAPRRGDELRIGGTVYRIEEVEPDGIGVSVRCTLGTVAS